MKFFLDFIRSRIITLVCIIIAAVIFTVVLSLYNLPSEPVLYALLLSLAAVTAIGAVTFIKAYKKHNILTRLANEITVSADNLPKAVSADDKDYGRLINTLSDYCISLKEKSANSLQATNEYYTMWVHQIKTPISAMRLMLQSEDSENNRRLSDELMKIEQYVDMALCYVRLESSGNDLVIKHYSLDDIVKKSVRKFSTQFIGKKLSLDYKELDTDVLTDEKWLSFIIEQLLSNAIKYTPDGGRIIFEITELDSEPGYAEYQFTISDNGMGMSQEFISTIFSPFTRAENSVTNKVQGTGLGMTISRNIVNLMNGNIKVESTLHKGTKITVTIYLELQEKEKEQDRNLMNLPVLVVDDDKICCESTVATLKEIGITGEWVLSGREAVERCHARHELKNDYFAVILDWKMPDMDGIETARQIRKRIGKEITIIVLTSYEFSEIEEEAKAAGVDAFIAKPLFRSRLTAALRQFTSGRKEKTARNYLDELSEADYTGKRILLVEDNELNREIAVEILQMTGAEVETAENGKIAVEKVEASPKGLYDLIFMDIQMPVMNGYEATAAIRSLPGKQGKLPIVAMTANAFAEDVQLAKNTGMNGHIAKPLDMNKLSDVLKKWL